MSMFFEGVNAGVAARLKTTTVRDFDGGWNVIDSDLNLAPKFSKILDNMFRGDGGFNQVRYGTTAFAAGDDGTITDNGSVSLDVTTTIGSNIVAFLDTGHTLLTGDHIELTSFSADIDGIPLAEFTGRFEITRIDNDNYNIRVTTVGVAGLTASRTFNQTYNTHTIAGFLVNQWYFQDNIIAVDTAGEVFRVNASGTITKIWSDQFARALSGAPASWSAMTFASAAVFKGEMIVCNGIDKPLLLDTTGSPEVGYLQDIPVGTNANTPICRYVVAMPEFLVMAGDPLALDRIHISNQGSSGTWQGDAAPNNGIQRDIGQHTPSFNQTIRSIVRYRSFLLVVFEDTIVPVTLGVFDSVPNHVPTINDVIEKHGTVSDRSVVSLGKDVLMVDHIGVPSVAQAVLTSAVRPERVSQLIDPALQRNIQRLTVGYAEDGMFALFNPRDRQYMLFIPKHETGATLSIPYNSIETLAAGTKTIRFDVSAGHELDVGDRFTLAGATAVDGITAVQLNITHTVTVVIDEAVFEVETAGTSVNGTTSGGGGSMVMTYIQDETVGYIYNTSRSAKNNSWARFLGWDWRCGCVSQLGRTFFGTQRRIYIMGAREDPAAGDRFNESDTTWANNTAYVLNHRALDATFGRVYRCIKVHTSALIGTFEAQRIANPELWEDYEGDEIDFVWELPWADFDKRLNQKQILYIGLDTSGTAVFDVKMFVDNLYRDANGVLTPILTGDFAGGSVRGFGNPGTPFGSSRLANDERPWPWPARCKIAKMRFEGSVTRPLKIIAISLAYIEGSIYR